MRSLLNVSLLVLVLAVFISASFAQPVATGALQDTEKSGKAIQIDEFGEMGDCDAGARVDNFFIQLMNNKEAIGYVITYSGRDALPAEYDRPSVLRQIMQRIAIVRSFDSSGYDTSRVVFINGGFREKTGGEMFMVFPGGIPPKPSKTIPRPRIPSGTFIWSKRTLIDDLGTVESFVRDDVKSKREADERAAELAEAIERAKNGTQLEDLESSAQSLPDEEIVDQAISSEELRDEQFAWTQGTFGKELGRRSGATGTIIFYADDEEYDIVKFKRFVEEGRDLIASKAKLKPEKITVVFGGYRDVPMAEFHIVPKGGTPAKAKPDHRPIEQQNENPELRPLQIRYNL